MCESSSRLVRENPQEMGLEGIPGKASLVSANHHLKSRGHWPETSLKFQFGFGDHLRFELTYKSLSAECK